MSKKRLSFTQIAKKEKLLSETRTKITGHTKKQISKIWENYRGKKYVIEELSKYRKRIAHAEPEQIEAYRAKYFDKKEIAQKHLEYGNLIVTKKVRQKYSESDYFKVKDNKDLDETIYKIFNGSKKIRYVLVTLKIKLAETGQIMFVSDVLTQDGFEQLEEFEVTAEEKILEKLSFVTKYDGYELISKHIRIIYALPEKTTIRQKHRKNKK